jgi:hypothetical protein
VRYQWIVAMKSSQGEPEMNEKANGRAGFGRNLPLIQAFCEVERLA